MTDLQMLDINFFLINSNIHTQLYSEKCTGRYFKTRVIIYIQNYTEYEFFCVNSIDRKTDETAFAATFG